MDLRMISGVVRWIALRNDMSRCTYSSPVIGLRSFDFRRIAVHLFLMTTLTDLRNPLLPAGAVVDTCTDAALAQT
jgi:hypothetical protein